MECVVLNAWPKKRGFVARYFHFTNHSSLLSAHLPKLKFSRGVALELDAAVA